MPFPFEFPFDFDAWLSELLVATSPLAPGPHVLASPVNEGPHILVSTINQAFTIHSPLNTWVELTGRA